MKVLLSIRPEFAFKIFDGTEKYEYHPSIFRRHDIKTVVVRASNPVKKVIGELKIGKIICEEPRALWLKTQDESGITRKIFLDYFENRQKVTR